MSKQSRDSQSITFKGTKVPEMGDSTKFNEDEPRGAQDRLSGGSSAPTVDLSNKKRGS
jgi:hypothetical protein